MCQAFLKQRKTQILNGNKIQKIEDCYKEFFTQSQFRQEAEALEIRLSKAMAADLESVMMRLTALEAKHDLAAAACQKKASNLEKECLWRIQDAEELIKSRVTTIVLNAEIKGLEQRMSGQIAGLNK